MNRFRLLRFDRGLTLKEVSEGSGVAVGTLRRLEDGGKPSGPVVKKLAEYYRLSTEGLLGLPTEEAA